MSPEDLERRDEVSADGTPFRFELPSIGKKYLGDSPDDKKDEKGEKNDPIKQARQDNMMIIGLSGAYTAGSPAKDEEKKEKPPAKEGGALSRKDKEDILEYLEESIAEYRRYVENIGRNGLAAANLNYYRDDIQETLDLIKYDDSLNLKEYWGEIVKLDLQLRAKAPIHVREIGYNNFKQYQIINDPPLTHWWWYLNRSVAPPVVQPKFWEFWKKM